MSFFAIQKDSPVKEILLSLPECHPEFAAFGLDIKKIIKTDITLEQLCMEHQIDVDTIITYIHMRLDDLA